VSSSPLNVRLDQYEGPLDLLLDLIRKQQIDIRNIPIATITAQYLGYLEQAREMDLDIGAEFVFMAATLIHIKSRMLLPTDPELRKDDETGEDPREELVQRLLEHERFKNAAQMLLQKQALEEAVLSNPALKAFKDDEGAEAELAVDVVDIVRTFQQILERARNKPVLAVDEESVTVGQMIEYLRRRLTLEERPVKLKQLLQHTQSQRALICMFLALLELVRLQAILLRQVGTFGDIIVKKHENFDTVLAEQSAVRDDWR
jgi:segregation and condensation protein A